MHITLINPYELGRQPFGLAEPVAWLQESGHHVTCLDLSLQRLESDVLQRSNLIGIYVAMHTAARIALEALPKIKEVAPDAHLCVFGLYAPMNESLFRSVGVETILGGEYEPGLLSLTERLTNGRCLTQIEPIINRSKIEFKRPDRSGLPQLSEYARLILTDDTERVMGFAETTRGCKHLCRHCPVVPVYEGKFRVIPLDIVMQDIRQQIKMGAQHISFGDPDFLNGPTHAKKIVTALHDEFPNLTYDCTIKVQHILANQELLPILRDTGCLFVISAIESVDDQILESLAKNHTSEDFARTVYLMRDVGIALAPTFVAFNPWITLDGYIALLQRLVELKLVESVPPIQLAIRLLIPEGSYLLQLPGFNQLIEEYDQSILGYPWKHRDPRVDELQSKIQRLVEESEQQGTDRREVFAAVWALAYEALGEHTPSLPTDLGRPIPHHSEPWYCCAEPTSQQLQNF